jgi:ParB-like chromosome segregation protein Spo0J
VLVRDSSGYKVIAGHGQYHAAVLARKLNPRAGETIPAIVLEAENQSAVLAQLKILKVA